MNTEVDDLSFLSAELLQSLLGSSLPPEIPAVSEDELIRFAFGWGTEAEEERVLEALVISGDLRKSLVRIRTSLETSNLRSEPVSRFLTHATEVAVAALAALERGLDNWKSDFEESLVVRYTVQSMASRSMSSGSRLAFTRSAMSLAVLEHHNAPTTFCAEITKSGELAVWGEVHTAEGVEGRLVRLEILDDLLGPISVGVSQLEGGHWRFLVSDFGPWEPDVVPATRFQLSFAEETRQAEPRHIVALADDGSLTELSLAKPPAIGDGRVSLTVLFDPEFRQRYSAHVLDLSINAGPFAIPLSSWNVSDLPKDGLLIAPVDSKLDGPLPRAAINISLRPL